MNWKNEQEYKNSVVFALSAKDWDVQVHEDLYSNFIPDISFGVNFTDGWIEIKYAKKVPASLGSIKHYTRGQQRWLIERGRAGGGHCYLLLGTPNGHFLISHTSLSVLRDLPLKSNMHHVAIYDETLGGLVNQMQAGIFGNGQVAV